MLYIKDFKHPVRVACRHAHAHHAGIRKRIRNNINAGTYA